MLGTSEPIGVVKNMIPTNSTLQGLVAFLAGPTDNPRKNHYTWQHKINNNYIDTSLHLPDY